jgi:hypothetical protein
MLDMCHLEALNNHQQDTLHTVVASTHVRFCTQQAADKRTGRNKLHNARDPVGQLLVIQSGS